MRNKLLTFLCCLLGLIFSVHARANESVTFNVLCYHNILDDPFKDPERYTLSTAELVQHFTWLKEHDYKVISIDDLIKAKAGKYSLPDKAVLLTFDDGYKSFYTTVYPLLKLFNYPAVLGLVGSWLQLKPGEIALYDGHNYGSNAFLSLEEIREIAASGLVEIASHSYDLHHGVISNLQGNLLPAAVTRIYDANKHTREDDVQYLSRIRLDLSKNSDFIQTITGKRPRVMVWPYGRYNFATINIAQSLDMPITLTLDEGLNSTEQTFSQIKRYILGFDTSVADLAKVLSIPTTSKVKPERVVQVDLDYVYDPDPARQEVNLGKLLDRIKDMGASTVYLQAFADPDGNGAADALYFPNRHLPMRADLFNRAAWQLRTRTGVKVYAWMPLLAFELPSNNPLATHRVLTASTEKDNDSYPRLTPFDNDVRQLITEIYEDLAINAIFDGILFHDDATLNENEDASKWALDYYSKEWGLPSSVSKIRSNQDSLSTWTNKKAEFLTKFSLDLAQIIRQYQPQAKTARNMYAEVVLNPEAKEWLAQSLPNFLQSYDYTAVMSMPYMENADKPIPWLKNLIHEIAKQPLGLTKTVFELQSVDWKNEKPVDSSELADQMRLLQTEGASNFGYYPDDFLHNSPQLNIIRPAFSLQEFPFSGTVK